jgi:hypothetical protein
MIKSRYAGLRHGPINSFIRQDNLLELNPFVMWDHFKLNGTQTKAGFDFHGHSGLAAITYVLHSDLTHEDSQGNVADLPSGSLQLLVAGAGALHKETLTSADGDFEAFQLWTALPKAIEMGDARYQSVPVEDIPIIEDAKTKTKVLVGEFCQTKSPVEHVIDMDYFHITLKEQGARWHHSSVTPKNSRFIYVLKGRVSVFGEKVASQVLIALDADTDLDMQANSDDCEVLFVSASALTQPILATGPSVHSSYDNARIGHQNIQYLLQNL